jgi:hypothetical protein
VPPAAPATPSPKRSLVYAYAAVAGHPAPRVLARLGRLPDGNPPRLLAIDDNVSVIVADVPADVYNREAIEQRLSDLDWVTACGAAHHAVSDAFFATHLVVPLRLFTLFASDARAGAALGRLRPRILKAFARLEGRKEFVLRVGRPEASRADGGEAAHAASGRPETGTIFLRVKATSRRAAAERQARAARSALEVFDALSAIAADARPRTAPPGTNLLLDAAFLVDTRRSASFRRTLTRAAANLLRDGCPVSLTGPWPPYSFASAD